MPPQKWLARQPKPAQQNTHPPQSEATQSSDTTSGDPQYMPVLGLQRKVGNAAAARMLAGKTTRPTIQRDTASQASGGEGEGKGLETDFTADEQDFPELGFRGHTTLIPPGVRVVSTVSGQPAESKLHPNDLLISMNANMLWGAGDLRDAIIQAKDGDQITFSVLTQSAMPNGPAPGLQGQQNPLGDFFDPWNGGSPQQGQHSGASGGGGKQPSGGGGMGGFFEDTVWAKRAANIQREPDASASIPVPQVITVTLPVNKEDIEPPIREWTKVLPTVGRDFKTKITKVAGKPEIKVPAVDIGHITRGQLKMIEKIKDNRKALPAEADKYAMETYQGDKNAGYRYNGQGSKNVDPTGGTDAKRQEVLKQIQLEIGHEGGYSAVNTYDDAIVTLGRGFTRVILAKIMQQVFQAKPEIKEMFLNVGVTWENDKARVLNFENGGIEEGDNALRLIQFDTGILNLFVSLAESEEYGATIAKAQNDHTAALKVPQSVVNTWTDIMAIRLAAHAIHGRGALSWASFSATGGDVHKIMKIVTPVIGGSIKEDHGGALVMSEIQTQVFVNNMAHGKAKEGFDSPAPVVLKPPLAKDSMKGVALFHISGNKYYKQTL